MPSVLRPRLLVSEDKSVSHRSDRPSPPRMRRLPSSVMDNAILLMHLHGVVAKDELILQRTNSRLHRQWVRAFKHMALSLYSDAKRQLMMLM